MFPLAKFYRNNASVTFTFHLMSDFYVLYAYKYFIYTIKMFTHYRTSLAFTVSQQSVDVDGLAILCGQEFSEPLQSPHSVSSSWTK